MSADKCFKCGRDAIGRLTVDLDLRGIPYCQEHEELIRLAMLALLIDGEEAFNDFLSLHI